MKFLNEFREEVEVVVKEGIPSDDGVEIYRLLHMTDNDHQTMVLTTIEADALYTQLGRLLRKGR